MSNRTITVSLPHNLPEAEVKQRLINGLNGARARFGEALSGVQESWTANHADFGVSAMGQSVAGRIDIRPREVQLQLDLPPILAMFADKLRPHIEREGRRLLDSPRDPGTTI